MRLWGLRSGWHAERGVALLAVLLLAPLLPTGAASADDAMQSIYRVKGRDGRVTYTNIVEQVPVELREQSRVDLSRVALNSELGSEINRRLNERHAKLSASGYCRELTDSVARGVMGLAWSEHAEAIVAACVSLLLLMVLPGAVRRAGAAFPWRMLSVLLPLGFLIVLAVRSIDDSREGFALLEEKAKPCFKETFAKLDETAQPLKEKTQLLDKLETEALSAGSWGLLKKSFGQ